MEHNLTVEAILLYQKASLVADDLRKQQNQGNRPPIPTAFAREFFAFIDRPNALACSSGEGRPSTSALWASGLNP